MKIILLAAVTINGRIAQHKNQPATWTSKEDKQFFVEETKRNQVIIMGENTYLTIGRPLPGRLNIVLTPKPQDHQSIPNELEYVNLPPEKLVEFLASRGFERATLGGGAFVYGEFLKAGLVDEIKLTVEPKIFGSGLNLFADTDVNPDLELVEVKKLGEHVVLLHYKVIKKLTQNLSQK